MKKYLLILILLLSACHSGKTGSLSPFKSEPSNGYTQINWVAPNSETSFYIIRYGAEAEKLTEKVKVSIRDIEKNSHPKHGLIYRYTVEDLNPSNRFFFSLQAGNKHGLSKETPVAEEKVKIVEEEQE